MNTIVIDDLSEARISPAFSNNNVPLCLFSSNEYAPYCGVLINSVVQNSTSEHNYDIIVLERNISDNNKRLMLSLIENRSNFSIRFIDVSVLSSTMSVNVHGHFALESCLKLYLLSDVFSEYDKFVTTDSDLIFNRDIAELYNTNVEDSYLAAVDDVIMKYLISEKRLSGGNSKAPKIPAGDYISEYLEMGTDDAYYNTGVVVFNLKNCRKDNIFEKCYKKLNSKNYWFIEQDVLNEVCCKKIKNLDIRWNVLNGNKNLNEIKNCLCDELSDEYKNSLDDYYIMHFAGANKPWLEPDIEYAERFFKYARTSPWYELILFKQNSKFAIKVSRNVVKEYDVKTKASWQKAASKKCYFTSIIKNIVYPPYTKRRENYDTIKLRKKDKQLTIARKEMNAHLSYMRKNSQKKGMEYYDNYQTLLSLKGRFKGMRCFIVGNGPSLTTEDLDLIKNEISFGMNSIYKLFSDTDWRPTYYVTNDVMLSYKMKVPQKARVNDLISCLTNYQFENCFVSSSKFDKYIRESYSGNVTFLPTTDYLYMLKQPRFPKVSCDCANECTAFGTTAFLIYQLAVYMGFTKIFFLGTDCDYSSEKVHAFKDDEHNAQLYADKAVAKQLENALLRGFCAINRDKLLRPGTEIYNVTRGGKLEIFPRMCIEEIEGLRS